MKVDYDYWGIPDFNKQEKRLDFAQGILYWLLAIDVLIHLLFQ